MARLLSRNARESAILLVFCATLINAADTAGSKLDHVMSSAGRLAQQQIATAHHGIGFAAASGGCFNEPDCPERPLQASELQSETSIAVDRTGNHIVVGFNDFRGFGNSVPSISGFMYSDDGGKTFTDGGQLPTPGNQTLNGQRYPRILGDPDVKYVKDCTFVYTSIGVETFGGSGLVQTLVFHRSRDCGHTWEGPFEIPSAVNPNGQVDVNGNAIDVADKELTDIDPDTLRYMACWTNFTPAAVGGIEISCTHSDNIFAAQPAFSARKVVAARLQDGTGSSVRFFGNGSAKAILAWVTFPSLYTNGISYATSDNNGETWSTPRELAPDFLTMDQVLGNDRVNSNPSVAVDRSSQRHKNNVYIVYSNNDSQDGADVMMQRSTDGGQTFSSAVAINRRPGRDRAQWFPFATVDRNTGRVYVFYYDQGVARSGDRTQVAYTYSDNGGLDWKHQRPLTSHTFKAGWGNDANQPNLGDYNQAVAQHGTFYASYAVTHQVGFTDGQPNLSMTIPNVEVKIRGARELEFDEDFTVGSDVLSDLDIADENEYDRQRHRNFSTLLSENFDSVAPGTLPAGWTTVHGGGANFVPWTTTKSFAPGVCGSSNKAFHQEANDSTTDNQARWERLFSPRMTVPDSAQSVSVDFDVCYDTEDDPILHVLAYDGLFLRLSDLTPGRTPRSVLAEAFDHIFTTDDFKHYPKHFPRNSDPAYFDDMSAWAGFSGTTQHVHMVFPGMAGSVFQLRFEYTQDQAGLCSDLRPGQACGVTVDNVVVRSISSDICKDKRCRDDDQKSTATTQN